MVTAAVTVTGHTDPKDQRASLPITDHSRKKMVQTVNNETKAENPNTRQIWCRMVRGVSQEPSTLGAKGGQCERWQPGDFISTYR